MKTKHFAYALLAVSFLSACSDDEKKLDPTTPIYQEYEVFVDKASGINTASANFRAYNSLGQRVKLNNGASLRINGQTPTYFESVTNTDPVYNYAAVVPEGASAVTFSFTRTEGHVYTNSVELDLLQPVSFASDLSEIANGLSYPFEAGLETQTITIRLVPSGENDFTNAYSATLGGFFGASTFSFSGVPAGPYILVADSEVNVPTTQNDASSGGMIHYLVRVTKKVTVAD